MAPRRPSESSSSRSSSEFSPSSRSPRGCGRKCRQSEEEYKREQEKSQKELQAVLAASKEERTRLESQKSLPSLDRR